MKLEFEDVADVPGRTVIEILTRGIRVFIESVHRKCFPPLQAKRPQNGGIPI
jgi:hypothetical protein